MKNFFQLTLSCCFFLASCQAQQPSASNISAADFQKAIAKEGVQLLDVRTQEEFNAGYIANALWADWNQQEQFKERVAALDKSKPLYVYCLSGGRSGNAQKWLMDNGFSQVINLNGGINAWRQANMPLAAEKLTTQMSLKEYLEQIPTDVTVLVDFGAKWCPPCKKMDPILEELQKQHGDAFKLIKIDGGAQANLCKEMNVTAFPVFIVYKKGVGTWRAQGLQTVESLWERLK